MRRLATTRGGSGEPLLLIHGLGSSRTIWDRARPELEREFDVIAIDLPGFGDQPWPDGSPPTMDFLANAVVAELDALGVERPLVVGNSMGGWIAIELGRRGRARELIAIGPVGGLTEAEARKMRRGLWATNFSARLLGPISPALLRLGPARRLGFREVATADVPYERALQATRYMAGSRGYKRLLDDVAGAGGRLEPNLERFAQVDCPVLIAFGSSDRVVPPASGPRLVEAIEGAELRVLEGHGYSPMLDRPAEIAELIRERFGARAA